MRFGEVFDFRTAEEAKQFIGKEGVFGDYLWEISEYPELEVSGRLIEAVGTGLFPFIRQYEDSEGENRRTKFQFFRPILEEDEPLMTNRQLAEWLSRGNGEYALENNGALVATHFSYGKSSVDDPVEDYVIRRWRDTEWMRPTKAIYEEDCK